MSNRRVQKPIRTLKSVDFNEVFDEEENARSYGLDIKQLKAWKISHTNKLNDSEESQQELTVKNMKNIILMTGKE